MAINSRYRKGSAYYGGRYNPSNIYGRQQRQDPEVISMYNPEVEARFSQALRSRQKRFDKATLAASQALSNIGGMDTYDAPELQKRLSSMRERLNTLVQDKYNGDYGAASNEIVNMIGAERTHPFYRFNKQKLKAVKTFKEDQRRHGANFMSTKDPTNISFEDWQEGEDFSYTPINKQDIVKASANIFKAKANDLMSDPDFESIEGGKFLQRRLQFGFRNPQEAYDFLETDMGKKMVESIKSSMPELAKLDETEVMDAIGQGALAGIGRSKFETRVNPDYIPSGEGVPTSGSPIFTERGDMPKQGLETAFSSQMSGFRDAIVDNEFKNMEKDALKTANMKEINTYDDLQKAIQKITGAINLALEGSIGAPRVGTANWGTTKWGTLLRQEVSPESSDESLKIKELRADLQELENRRDEIDKAVSSEFEKYGEVSISDKGKIKVGKVTVPTFGINELSRTTTKGMNLVDNLQENLNEVVTKRTEIFKSAEGRKGIEELKSITDDLTVTNVALNPAVENGLIFGVEGRDKTDNKVESIVHTQDDLVFKDLMRFVYSMPGGPSPEFVKVINDIYGTTSND